MLRDALLDAWAILLPVDCAGCGAADRALCSGCRAALTPRISVHLTPGGLRVLTAVPYEGAVRRVILALKQQDRTDAAPALAASLTAAIRASPSAELAPVPTSAAAFRARGYDPVALLLRRGAHRPVRALVHTRRTAHQKSLGVVERATNLSGAFAARGDLSGRRFLLIDDIMTTGATLDEAARAVREDGGEVVGGATLAFTKRLRGFRDNTEGEDYGGAKGARD